MEFDTANLIRFDPRTQLAAPVRAHHVPRAGSPDQPRDDDGRWGEGGGGGEAKDEGSGGRDTKQTAKAVKATSRAAEKTSAKVEKAHAAEQQAHEAADAAAKHHEAAEAAAQEAEQAEEEADAAIEALADDEDATVEDKLAAHEKAREARTTAKATTKEAQRAEAAKERAEARIDETESAVDEADADHAEALAAKSEAADEHDAAELERLAPVERLDRCTKRADATAKEHDAAEVASQKAVEAYEHEAKQPAAAGTSSREAARALKESERKADRALAAAERTKASRDFWEAEKDAAEGEIDGDGDGRTGDAEERDDKPQGRVASLVRRTFRTRAHGAGIRAGGEDQPRDDDGKWTDGGGGGGKEKKETKDKGPRVHEKLPIKKVPGRELPAEGMAAFDQNQVKNFLNLNEEEGDAIGDYSDGYDWAMREVDKGEKSDQEIIDAIDKHREENPGKKYKDTPEKHLEKAKVHMKHLESAMAIMDPLSERDVFRGIKGLDKATFDSILNADTISLGAVTSTSWDSDIAKEFAELDYPTPGTYQVLFSLKTRSGVGIEWGSKYTKEREVLVGKGTRYKVTEVYRPEGPAANSAIVIKAEEIDGDGDGLVGDEEEQDDDDQE